MNLQSLRVPKPARNRGSMTRLSSLGATAALLVLACLLFVFDMGSKNGAFVPPLEPGNPFEQRAAELDDPVGFKAFWLAQKGHSNRSIEAVARHKHRSAKKKLEMQLKQPGVICSNSCFKANDGICDEGRRGNLSHSSGSNWVYCDLGTDCQDCGPWQGEQHGPAWTEGMGPIAYLQLNGVEVRVKQVPFAPSFVFAFTDPAIDSDQSVHMNTSGVVEPGISQVFFKVLSKRCRRDAPGSKGLVVDVGGNYGWFALLSAAMGCSVVSIEPVPIFRAFMEYSAARNHLTSFMEIIPAVVALDTSKTYTINAPLIKGAQWGASGIDVPHYPGSMQVPARAVHLDALAYARQNSIRALLGLVSSQGRSLRGIIAAISSTSGASTDSKDSIQVSTGSDASDSVLETVSKPVPEPQASAATDTRELKASDKTRHSVKSSQPLQLFSKLLPAKLSDGIDILKVDVEGREPDVFATASKLLDSGLVQNIIMEYSPGYYYQASDRLSDMPLLPSLLLEIVRHNYSLVHIPWGIAHNAYPMKVANGWDAALPTMDAITAPQLAYDLWTTQHIKNGSLPGMHGPSSWPCPEMAKSGMSHTVPGNERMGMHILFHPKSFMANFVFNTNIWASRDKTLQVPGTALFNDRERFPFYYPSDSRWFPQAATSDTHEWGLPWAYCKDVQPQFQVAHRCRCRSWDVCGEHQVAVQQCVLKKQLGYDNLPDDQIARAISTATSIMAARRNVSLQQ